MDNLGLKYTFLKASDFKSIAIVGAKSLILLGFLALCEAIILGNRLTHEYNIFCSIIAVLCRVGVVHGGYPA